MSWLTLHTCLSDPTSCQLPRVLGLLQLVPVVLLLAPRDDFPHEAPSLPEPLHPKHLTLFEVIIGKVQQNVFQIPLNTLNL